MPEKNCNIIHLSEVSSTNEHAKALVAKGRPAEGSVVLTDFQTAGKGHDNNSWESEAGKNILMTMILYPEFLEISRQFRMSMAVALGIIDFLKEYIPEKVLFVKWPNDIYVGNKKIGGILINIEIMGNSFEYVIAGIGINMNQVSFSDDIPNPVSLYGLTGNEYMIEQETIKLWDCVMGRYTQLKEGSFEQIESDYLGHLLGLDEERDFVYRGKQISATIKGVNEFGHLILDTRSGTIECDLKEVSYIFI